MKCLFHRADQNPVSRKVPTHYAAIVLLNTFRLRHSAWMKYRQVVQAIDMSRQSIAGTRQEIIAPVVWIGSEKINVAQLMLDTVAFVQQLAEQLASHTNPSTGQPTNSSAIAQSGQQAAALSSKYSPVIGK